MEEVNILNLIRTHVGLERGALAAFARNHGISLSYASLIVNGKRNPPTWLLQDMGVWARVRRGPSGQESVEYFIDK